MKRYAAPTFLALVLAFSACAQDTSTAPSKPLAQASGSPSTAGNALNLPSDTAILARLVAELDLTGCKEGDRVEAQITQDVKDGHQTVLKKGALVIGRITRVQAALDAGGVNVVWILFQNVEAKTGEPSLLNLDIQAIAPPPTKGSDNLNGTDRYAIAMGHMSAKEGFVDVLTAKSKGAIGLPGVDLAFQNSGGAHKSMLVFNKRNIHLVKGSQIVFRVVNP
jgi:hypothetical protein